MRYLEDFLTFHKVEHYNGGIKGTKVKINHLRSTILSYRSVIVNAKRRLLYENQQSCKET